MALTAYATEDARAQAAAAGMDAFLCVRRTRLFVALVCCLYPPRLYRSRPPVARAWLQYYIEGWDLTHGRASGAAFALLVVS